MAPPAEVGRLVERFEEQREDYRRGRYNEAQLREDFLNPLFKALGWDVHNDHPQCGGMHQPWNGGRISPL